MLGDLVAAEIGFGEPYKESTVRGWKNRGVVDVDVVWGLAAALGVSFAWLAVGEGEMRPPGALPRQKPTPRLSVPPEPVEPERGLREVRELVATKQQRPASKGGAKRRRPPRAAG
ncbi:MAG TPA: helix-turn-helix domain-containing protein [Phytomonospora sp.]